MTDLERARALIQYWKDCEQYVGQHMSLSTNFETLVPIIAAALAAARREAVDDIAELKCDISRLLESLRLAEEEIDDLRSQLAAERGA